MKKAYLHTINGHPAWFAGGQICYLNNKVRKPLRDSLAEIKADQKATIEWRAKQGFETDVSSYDYRMFYV